MKIWWKPKRFPQNYIQEARSSSSSRFIVHHWAWKHRIFTQVIFQAVRGLPAGDKYVTAPMKGHCNPTWS